MTTHDPSGSGREECAHGKASWDQCYECGNMWTPKPAESAKGGARELWIELTEHVPMIGDEDGELQPYGEPYFDVSLNSRMNLVTDRPIPNSLRVVDADAYEQLKRERDEWKTKCIGITQDLNIALSDTKQQRDALKRKLYEQHDIRCPYPDCGRPFWFQREKNPDAGLAFVLTPVEPLPPTYKELQAQLQAAEERTTQLKIAVDKATDIIAAERQRAERAEAERDIALETLGQKTKEWAHSFAERDQAQARVRELEGALQNVHVGIAQLRRPEHGHVTSMRAFIETWDWGFKALAGRGEGT